MGPLAWDFPYAAGAIKKKKKKKKKKKEEEAYPSNSKVGHWLENL